MIRRQKALKTFKQNLTTAPVLTEPDIVAAVSGGKPFIIIKRTLQRLGWQQC